MPKFQYVIIVQNQGSTYAPASEHPFDTPSQARAFYEQVVAGLHAAEQILARPYTGGVLLPAVRAEIRLAPAATETLMVDGN